MFHYFSTITNARGDSLRGWQVEVVEVADGTTVVPIYGDENGTPIVSTSGVADRALSDDMGNYDFFVDEGDYSLRFYDASGVFQRIQRYLSMYGAEQAATAAASADAAATSATAAETAAATASGASATATTAAADALQRLTDVNTAGATQVAAVETAGAVQVALAQGYANNAAASASDANASALAAAALTAGSSYADYATGMAATAAGDVFYVVADDRLNFYKNGTSADEADVYFRLGKSGGEYTEVYLADLLTPAQLDWMKQNTAPFVEVGALLQALINEVGTLSPVATNQSAPNIVLPAGTMRFEQSVNLKRIVTIRGAGNTLNANSSPTFIWVAPDTDGIVVNFNNTFGDRLETASDPGYGYTAAMSRLEGFLLRSEGGTDPSKVGIRVRAKCSLERLTVYGFPGNNVHAYCTANSSSVDRVGNCSYSSFTHLHLYNSLYGSGLFIDGGDANVILIDSVDFRNNALCGVFDSCLLGNHYGVLHTAGNGTSLGAIKTSAFRNNAKFLWIGTPAGSLGLVSGSITGGNIQPGSDLTIWQWDGPSTATDAADGYTTAFALFSGYSVGQKVLYDGHRFTMLTSAGNRTLPFSESTNWLYVGQQTVANLIFPEWDSGATYYHGGSFITDEANAFGTVAHLYEEGSQASSIASKTFVGGGAFGITSLAISGAGTAWKAKGWVTSTEHTHPAGLGTMSFFPSSDSWLSFKYVKGSAQGMELRQDTTNHDYQLLFGGSAEALRLTTSATLQAAGRASAIGQGWMMALKLMIGSSATNARELTNGTVAPASGQAAKGDICFNRTVTAGGSAGWMCTTGGTNGSTSVWKTMANVAA